MNVSDGIPKDVLRASFDLLDHVKQDLVALQSEAAVCRQHETPSARLNHISKHLLGDLGSVLDYAARGLARAADVPNSTRVSFPVGKPERPTAGFPAVFDRDLPRVRLTLPAVYNVIQSVQAFSDRQSHPWLWLIRQANNQAKHNEFSITEPRTWLHVGMNSDGAIMHIFCESMVLGDGALIECGRLSIHGPGNFGPDNVPDITGEGDGVAERLVDFELKAIGAPLEWAIIDGYASTRRLLDDLSEALP